MTTALGICGSAQKGGRCLSMPFRVVGLELDGDGHSIGREWSCERLPRAP